MTMRTLLTRRIPVFCAGLAVSMAALGGPSALSPASGSVTASRSAATTLNFPVTRSVGGSTDNAYDIYLGYRTLDGTAIAGTDYTGISAGQFLLAANTLNPSAAVNIPVTVAAATGETGTRTLQLVIDSATGVGPAISFPNASSSTNFSTGPDSGPVSAAIGDLNGDGKPDLAVATFTTKKISVLLNTAATGASTPTYATAVDFDAGESARSVALGDVNGDGKLDLAVAITSSKVSVLLNTTTTGAATPSFATAVRFNAGVSPTSVAMGDINGDGKPDLVVTNGRANVPPDGLIAGNVSVLLNTTLPGAATPSYEDAVNFNANSGPVSVAIGDVNGDGRPDLAVVNNSTNNVSVLLNTGAAPYFSNAMAANNFAVGIAPGSIAMGDINGDGKPDLAVTNGGSTTPGTTVSILLNTTSTGTSAPSYASAVNFTVGAAPRSVALSDLNGDGKLDLAVANSGTASTTLGTTVSVLLNITSPGASTPRYATAVTSTVGTSPRSVAVSDVNGDGKPDLAVANFASNDVSVLLNATPASSAAPSFASPERFGTGTGGTPQSIAMGDLNGDGRPDLVVANTNNDQLAVLFDTTPPGATTPVYQAAATFFSTGDNPLGVVLGDLNNDGRLDVVVANRDSDSVTAYLNNIAPGSGANDFAFTSLSDNSFVVGMDPIAVAIGDLDGDGRLDLVVANEGTAALTVLRNVTTAGDAQPQFAPGLNINLATGPARSIAIGDINGDGIPDLVGGHAGQERIFVLIKKTSAAVLDSSSYDGTSKVFNATRKLSGVVLRDFNADGRLDVAGVDATSPDNSIVAFLNANPVGPAASYEAALLGTNFATGNRPTSIASGDFNGDGKPDLAVTNTLDSTVTLLLNNTASVGPPIFTSSTLSPFATAGGNSDAISIGDVNGDGRPDLVTANAGTNNVSVLLNTQYLTAFLPSTVTGSIIVPAAVPEDPVSDTPTLTPTATVTSPIYRGGATSLWMLMGLLLMTGLRKSRQIHRSLVVAVLLCATTGTQAGDARYGVIMMGGAHRDGGFNVDNGAGLHVVLGTPVGDGMNLEANMHLSSNPVRNSSSSIEGIGAGADLRMPLLENWNGSFVVAGLGVQRDDLRNLGAGIEYSPSINAGLGMMKPLGANTQFRGELRTYIIHYNDFPGANNSVDLHLNLGVEFGL